MDGSSGTGLAGLAGRHEPAAGREAAPRLLFVHGVLGQHHQFDGWLDVLAGMGFDCHSISLRGRLGVPPERAAGVALSDYVEDVRAAARELGPSTVLIGHSLGALVCLKAASTLSPAALILLAPAPERAYLPAPGLLPALPWLMPRVLAGRSFRPPFRVVERIALNRVPEAERRPLYEAMVPDSGRAYRTFLLGAGADLAKIGCPVLVVAGGEDRVIPPRTARSLARRLKADFRLLPDHAHWLLAEPGWEEIAGLAGRWLAEAGAGGASVAGGPASAAGTPTVQSS